MTTRRTTRALISRRELIVAALALLVLVVLGTQGGQRTAQVSVETHFVERSAHGLAIMPASCASSPSQFHSALPLSGDSLGFVTSPGQSEYGASVVSTYVCVTNPTGSTYFVPSKTANELQLFKNAAGGLGVQAY